MLRRAVRGKDKETIAEVPGLFAEATVAACFGGRDQQLSLSLRTESSSSKTTKMARDPFVNAMGAPVERLGLEVRDAAASVNAEMAKVASTLQ